MRYENRKNGNSSYDIKPEYALVLFHGEVQKNYFIVKAPSFRRGGAFYQVLCRVKGDFCRQKKRPEIIREIA
jgi:hypothetical protein